MARLEGRTAIVTGAGRGIGRGIAMLLAQEGASVVVNDFGVNVDGSAPSSGPAAEVADEIKAAGGKAVPNFDTVATVEGGEALVKTALDSFGRLDILVNVAGILRDRMIFNMSEQEWDDVIAVHLKGHFCTTKPASIVMRQQRSGRIINFSSISGLGGLPGQANYGAAKAGIAGFTRVVARDLGRYGVTCNAIAPGAATRMTATVPQNTAQLRARAGTAPVAQAPRQSTVPPMREPEYVAPMTVFLACDEAWNINGKIFYVAGGRVSLAHEETAMRQIQKNGMWTIDELRELVPSQLMYGMVNPAPPPPDLDIPGRRVAAPA
ncbi:MAG TPA: SDR family NAD(P)-dependent oxidoreductase [Dehalococcoidia bacterium]|jgi:NAD(P)-dependent dehydrogenase (short-subunit alcohol dehydrogenase family)|nr:SDR family NAD(P)-dependent oxidoreductase [Dehalococcoidia bacterium]